MLSRIEKALINRDYARLWSGQALSSLGDAVFDTTLMLWIGTKLAPHKSWAPAAIAGVLLATSAAIVVVGPLAGVFVDRWNRRRTMLRTETFRGVLVGGTAVLAFLPVHVMPVGAWLALIYLTVFLVTCGGMFFNPARFATIGDVVPGDADRARAAGIGQATTSVVAIVGPPLAAPLLFTIGFQWAIVLNALSYVASHLFIRSIRRPDPSGGAGERADETSFWMEFREGLAVFRRNRYLVALLTTAVLCQLGTGGMSALIYFFVTENLHTKPQLLGFMDTAEGIGAVFGALLSGAIVRKFGARGTTWVCIVVSSLLFLLFARQTAFLPALAVVTTFAVPLAALNTSLTPLLLSVTPQEYLGRTMAVFNPINQSASMLSSLVAGTLASTALLGFHGSVAGMHIGRNDTILTAGAVMLLIGGVYAYFSLPRLESGSAADSEGPGGPLAESSVEPAPAT